MGLGFIAFPNIVRRPPQPTDQIALVYLAWAPLGPAPLRAFLRSYAEHPAGVAHELVVVLNGAAAGSGAVAGAGIGVDAPGGDGEVAALARAQLDEGPALTRAQLAAELEGVPHRVLMLERPLLDLPAYAHAARSLEHRRLCLLNSYSRVLADDWLALLACALQEPGVGMVGATGSWESQADWRRGAPARWLRQLSAIRAQRRDYPSFPNPHLRSTAVMLDRALVLELGLERARDKRDTYLLESGRQSITRELHRRGLRSVVVGRDGHSYEEHEWACSDTYRAGDQKNLLVADRRTDDWQEASSRMRRQLSRDAWGSRRAGNVVRADAPRGGAAEEGAVRGDAARGGAAQGGAVLADVATDAVEGGAVQEEAAGRDAAVVIVNYRSAAYVEQCVASVVEQAAGASVELEVVVIDNDSRDGSVERLRAALPRVRVVAMPSNGGFASGVNAGFRHTTAELVLLLNPDTQLRPGALRALLARMRANPRAGVVAPLLEDADGRLAPNAYRRFPGLLALSLDLCLPFGYAVVQAPALHPYAITPAASRAGARPAHVCGAALAIRRAAYEQGGPFDEGFFLYLEETEWQRRVATAGWEIELEPAARVCHLVRGGGEESLAPSPHFVVSALRYLRMRGVPVGLARAAFALSLALSWATLSVIACLPSKRARARVQARAYRALVRVALTARR